MKSCCTRTSRLFQVFALAFWLLGLQRLIFAFTELVEEGRTGLYLVRLFAFLLILWAIIDKNRAGGVSGGREGLDLSPESF